MNVTGPTKVRSLDRSQAAAEAPAARTTAVEQAPRVAASADTVGASRSRAAGSEGVARDRVEAQREQAPGQRPARGLNSMEGDVCRPTDLLDRGEMNGVAPMEINNKKGSNGGMIRGGGGVRRASSDEDCSVPANRSFDV